MNAEVHDNMHSATEAAGWRELLPAGARTRVLCLDVGDGRATLTLAQVFEQVVSVPVLAADAAAISQLAGSAGASNVTVLPTLDQALAGPAFDGVVAVLFGRPRGGLRPSLVLAMVRRAAAAVSDGFMLVAAANALACNRRPGSGGRGFRTWGARGLERLVTSGQRAHARSWPVLLSEHALLEVLHGSYRSPTGNARGAERLKEALLGGAGAAWFAPGYVTLGQRRRSALIVDELLEHVDEVCGGRSRLLRHIVKLDKTILVTETSGEERGRAVVVPYTPRALSRRSHEAEILRRARALPPRLRRLLPGFLGRGQHDGQDWLAIEEMPGIFVGEPVADLDQITERAAALLVDLHLETRREVLVDETVYDSLVGAVVGSARRRNPWCAEVLAQIDVQLRAELLGRTMPRVWMHGDYKIENVGLDPDSRRPVGIIDWELADAEGLPLVDLEYLLVYNRMLRDRVEFEVAYGEIADGTSWSHGERVLLEEYVAALGIDEGLRRVLRVLSVIYAVGVRLQYDEADSAECGRLLALLTACSALLKRHARSRTGGAA